jgi:hypothetical protein
MKVFHQLGHNRKWAIDSYFENAVGDGFIFGAYNCTETDFVDKVAGKAKDDYLGVSMIDLQYYGSKRSDGGKLDTYEFHPTHMPQDGSTSVDGIGLIQKGVKFQRKLGLKSIIVPTMHYEACDLKKCNRLLSTINKEIPLKRGDEEKVYMTLCIPKDGIISREYVEELMVAATDMSIKFDGYYIACEPVVEYKKKVSIDYKYYENLLYVFQTLKGQGFETIYAYANWDALLFSALCDIDYITIGTYENLRNFSCDRFTETLPGGPSKGWYFSERLLNFVRAQELDILRHADCLEVIANSRNIFSDTILDKQYSWNTHKPDVHKNYLLAISRLLKNLAKEREATVRTKKLIGLVEGAREAYKTLESKHKVYLQEESSNYHLGAWLTFLKRHQVE